MRLLLLGGAMLLAIAAPGSGARAADGDQQDLPRSQAEVATDLRAPTAYADSIAAASALRAKSEDLIVAGFRDLEGDDAARVGEVDSLCVGCRPRGVGGRRGAHQAGDRYSGRRDPSPAKISVFPCFDRWWAHELSEGGKSETASRRLGKCRLGGERCEERWTCSSESS